MFFTLVTPSTDFATASARVFWAALATVPVSVTTPLSTSTLIVESRRSSAAARSKRVLTQSQPSFKPVPTVRPDSFASRLYRSLFASYSSRVGALRLLFAEVTGVEIGVAVAVAFAFALAFAALLLFVLSHPATNTRSAPSNKNPSILRLIFAKSSLALNRQTSSENIRLVQIGANGGPRIRGTSELPLNSSFFCCVNFRNLGCVGDVAKQKAFDVIEKEILGVGTGEIEAVVIDDLGLLLQPSGPTRLADLGGDALAESVGERCKSERRTLLAAVCAFDCFSHGLNPSLIRSYRTYRTYTCSFCAARIAAILASSFGLNK